MTTSMTSSRQLTVRVSCDQITEDLAAMTDYEFNGQSQFTPPVMGVVPKGFSLGLIVGPSGSGKTTLLKNFGAERKPGWDRDRAIASHFNTAEEAHEKFNAVGLNTVPTWLRPFHVLSTGEKFRANLARSLGDNRVIDEFTSVVDRNVAASCSNALSRYAKNNKVKGLVLATCHYDVAEWLQPDWVFDTAAGEFTGRGSRCRPTIELDITPCRKETWSLFREHHYLSSDLNKSSRCWVISWEGEIVGFSSALAFPNGNFKNAWREHRTVVLPDYQGMGFGVRISDTIGEIFIAQGSRYFSKTAHPRFGGYRNATKTWRGTSKNGKARKDYREDFRTKEDAHKMRHAGRVCYSHEYIGG